MHAKRKMLIYKNYGEFFIAYSCHEYSLSAGIFYWYKYENECSKVCLYYVKFKKMKVEYNIKFHLLRFKCIKLRFVFKGNKCMQ